MLTIQGKRISVLADTAGLRYTVRMACGMDWTMTDRPYIETGRRGRLYFEEAALMSETLIDTGVCHGVEALYDFGEGVTVTTRVTLQKTRDDLFFASLTEEAGKPDVRVVAFPAGFDFDVPEGHGYTVLPRMQGTLVPAGHPIRLASGIVFERDAYIPVYGQVHDNGAYAAIFDTPYDARYRLDGERVCPYFVPSLGEMRYWRRMLYRFFEGGDYNTIAKSYRSYVDEHGELVPLTAKIAKNPRVARLIGAPIIHEGIAVHISPESDYYDKNEPKNNDYYTTFDERAEQLRALHDRGLTEAYIHLDGWGNHGYDNLHPDPFPPHEASGGAEGMKRLSDTARELGYIFGIHDQYRDYYYDAPSFDMDNACENEDGSHPFCSVWYGGPHSLLCATLAPEYVLRNYNTFEELGIVIEGSYLDVFSVVALDECFNKRHPMTREQCAIARRQCFDILTSRGIIPSSEETLGCMLSSQVLCHHAPFYTTNLGSSTADPVGIPIPFLNLVYHDCVVIPWINSKDSYGGWGIPQNDSAYMHAILNGNPVYCPIDADEARIAEVQAACALNKRVALSEMVRHEFVSENGRIQRTTFANGVRITVDFDAKTYSVEG